MRIAHSVCTMMNRPFLTIALVCACLPLGQASLAARLERNTAGTIMPAVVLHKSAAAGGVETLAWEELFREGKRTMVVAVVTIGMM